MPLDTERNTEPEFSTDMIQNNSTLGKPLVVLLDMTRQEHQMLL